MLGAFMFLAFFGGSVGYSAWKGGAPERCAAALLLLGLIGSASVGVIHIQGAFHSIPVRLAMVDGTLAAALMLLAVRANRVWLIPLAACQVAAVLGHVAKLAAPDMVPLGYAFLVSIWGWPMTGLLVFGTWCQDKRAKAGHLDRPWRLCWRPSERPAKIPSI